jgi:hypothetical protein
MDDNGQILKKKEVRLKHISFWSKTIARQAT